jgi:diguanylate cyclase (GGDEF)-like protein/PAS domain S-box-containing protein
MGDRVRDIGDRVFHFEQGEALLKKVMESAAIGMMVVGAAGHAIYANRALETMLGYPSGGCLGATAESMLFEEDLQPVMLRFGQLMRGEIADFRLECRIRHSDGQPLWTDASATLLRSDVTGRPLYAIVQLVNIERQKRAEEALAYNERRWASALESAGQGVWDFDTRSDSMYYSNTWRKLRGFEPDEEINDSTDTWLARVHPDDRERLATAARNQGKGVDGFSTLEYRERRRDGQYIWILSRGGPIERDENGEVIRAVGTDTDISSLKRIEEQLATEKERLRVTLQSIGESVVSIDADGSVSFINATAAQMTGWDPDEVVGRPLHEVFLPVHEATGLPLDLPLAVCLSHGEVTRLDEDTCLVGRTGERRDIRAVLSPIRTPDGSILGAVLVFQDVTSSRALQKQLAHSATHDMLTGLPNRLAFEHALITVADQARLELRNHALCFLDLDRFKPVNDTAGHAAGDELLRRVAEVIRAAGRRHDFAGRIGGDEFALILSDCPLPAAQRIAQRLVDAIAAIDFQWDDRHYRIGASVGITAIQARSGPVADLMSQADSACYAAKANGRGRVAIYDVAATRIIADLVQLSR